MSIGANETHSAIRHPLLCLSHTYRTQCGYIARRVSLEGKNIHLFRIGGNTVSFALQYRNRVLLGECAVCWCVYVQFHSKPRRMILLATNNNNHQQQQQYQYDTENYEGET